MAINFYSPTNWNQNEFQFPVIHKVSSAPSSPSAVSGQLYYNTSANTLHYHNGSGWQTVGTSSGSMTSFQLEDDDGTEVAIADAKEVKFIGSGITTNWTDTDNGTDGDPYDLTFTVDAAQTGITSVLNASLVVGRDAHNQIDFSTDNQIKFKTNNETPVIIMKASGEIEATSLDISGDADIDGTLEADAITVGGTALNTVIAGVTVTNATNAAHVLITDNESTDEENEITFIEGAGGGGANRGLEADGDFTYNPSSGTVSATVFKGNIDAVDGDFDGTLETDALSIAGTTVTSTAAELNILDGVTSTAAELNALDGITAVVGELNYLDLGSTAVGTAIASKAVILDSNKDYTGLRNVTLSGELDAGSLDVSGDADIDGTLETDALTVGGTNILTGGIITSLGTITQDTVTFTSANSTDPIVVIKNTTNDANGPRLRFASDKGAAGADNDSAGEILFTADDDNQDQVDFATIKATVADASNGAEGGKLTLSVATHDAEMQPGLIITDGDAEDEVDVTIGNGANSVVTIPGNLTVTGTQTVNNVVTVSTSNGVQFEGAAADGHDATLVSVVAASDKTYTLPNVTGYVALFSADPSTTAVSSTPAELNLLDGATVTTDEINILDGVTATAAEINLIDGGTARGTTAVVSGDGFLHNDGGTMRMTKVDKIADKFAGTGLSASSAVLSVDAAQTGITSLLATDIKIGEDDQTKIDFETADEIHFYANNVEQVYLGDNIFGPQSDSDVDLGATGVRWKDAFVDSITVTGEIDGASLDISGDADIDGTLETDALTIGGAAVLAQATASAVGAVELATAAEVLTGTDAARVVTADTLSAKTVIGIIDVSSLTDSKIVTIPHNLGTADVMVQMYDTVTEANVFADIARTTDDFSTADTANVSIDFGTDPPNDIRVVITSLAGASASGTVAYT